MPGPLHDMLTELKQGERERVLNELRDIVRYYRTTEPYACPTPDTPQEFRRLKTAVAFLYGLATTQRKSPGAMRTREDMLEVISDMTDDEALRVMCRKD